MAEIKVPGIKEGCIVLDNAILEINGIAIGSVKDVITITKQKGSCCTDPDCNHDFWNASKCGFCGKYCEDCHDIKVPDHDGVTYGSSGGR